MLLCLVSLFDCLARLQGKMQIDMQNINVSALSVQTAALCCVQHSDAAHMSEACVATLFVWHGLLMRCVFSLRTDL